jgi:hypothetical protein
MPGASEEGCGRYEDAPVCTNGNTDVEDPGGIYRGCPQGQTDCADNSDNPDDRCCMGSSGLGPGDNIDHFNCAMQDADFGGFSWCFSSYDSNKPKTY